MKRMIGSLVAAAALVAAALVTGCAGTKAAYQAAESPEDYAYVITEHYAAVLHEVTALKQSGKLTGDALAKAQALDAKLNPLVLKLRDLAGAYETTKDAKDAVALQQAIDKVVPVLADFVKLLKGANNAAKVQRTIELASDPEVTFVYYQLTR